MTQTFSAKGKFLFCGEYLVLEGAKAFATPLQLGQSIVVNRNKSSEIAWSSTVQHQPWFEAVVNNRLEIKETNSQEISSRLLEIIKAIQKLNPAFMETLKEGVTVEANMEFNKDWGLGSSSTLIALLAQWSGVNPYQLLEMTFGGSGYDIACAAKNNAVFYTMSDEGPQVEDVFYDPDYKQNMYFIYSGQKSNSRTGMTYFRNNAKWSKTDIDAIGKLSEAWPKASDEKEIMQIIEEAESRMATILNLKALKEEKFSDFRGAIKSLGAWGGDFFLVVSEDSDYLQTYFKSKNYNTILAYDDIVHFNPEKVIK